MLDIKEINKIKYLNVDTIYVISAKTSKRREIVTKRLKEHFMDFNFFDAVMIPEDPVKGCFTSHMTLIRQLKKQGCKRALIFEDDVVFNNTNHDITFINHFLDSNDWTIFYLGHRPIWMGKEVEKGIVLCHSHDTHAYIINLEKFNDYHINYKPSLIKGVAAIDGLYSIQKNCYCLYPMMCIQDEGLVSQIDNTTPDYNYQLNAEKNRYNIFYNTYGSWNLLVHQNHFKRNTGVTTIIVPILAIIMIVIVIILMFI